MKSKLKLAIDLVPPYSWGMSLSNILGTKEWNIIRQKQLELAENKCSICGNSSGKLFCHEEWQYNDDSLKQKLKGFKIVCQLCNDVIHIGQALRRNTISNYKEILAAHFMKINNCDRISFYNHFNESFDLLENRIKNKIKHEIDFGKFKPTEAQFLLFELNFKIKMCKSMLEQKYFYDYKDLIDYLIENPKHQEYFIDNIVSFLIKIAEKGKEYKIPLLLAMDNNSKIRNSFLAIWKDKNPNNLDIDSFID